MGRDEQKEEREVLDSIFPEEITDVSETEYRVAIVLDVPGASDDEENKPTIILRVQYPEDYPDVAPDLDLSSPSNAPKINGLDIHDDKARLLEVLQPTVEESLGMAMVFTIVSTLKDAAELLISERAKAAEALVEAEIARAEEEENRKFQGTAVTRESFLEWRSKFQKEMEEDARRKQEEKEAEEKKKRGPKEEKKLTGRELWEKGLAGKADADDDDDQDVNDVAAEVGKVTVTE